ncbi:MAG: hypothetical protein WD604_14555 [Balneolaceae bacterium]
MGIATVVAINVFGTSAASANEDAVRQDVLTIASSAQGWYIKPTMMGGGGNSFDGIDFTKFNFSAAWIGGTDNTQATNMNGTYELTARGATSLTVNAYPASQDGYAGNETTPDTDGTAMIAMVCQGDIAWEGDDCTST